MELINIDREQIKIFNCSLDSLVEENSKARLIVRVVDRLDTNKLYENNSESGIEVYNPKIMLATWFLAYAESVYSTNELEYNCKKNLDFIYTSANSQPSSDSLSNFLQTRRELLIEYFKEITIKLFDKGLLDFKERYKRELPAEHSTKEIKRENLRNKYLRSAALDISAYMKTLDNSDSTYKLETNYVRNKIEITNEKASHSKIDLMSDYRENHQVNI